MEERHHAGEADQIGGDAARLPGAIDALRREEMRDRIASLADQEIVDQVHRRPGHQEIKQQHEERAQQRDAIAPGQQRAGKQDAADGEYRRHARASGRPDPAERIHGGQQRQHRAVGVQRDHRQEARHRHDDENPAQAGIQAEPTSFNATRASDACSRCASQAPRPIIQAPDSDAPRKIAAISLARRVSRADSASSRTRRAHTRCCSWR